MNRNSLNTPVASLLACLVVVFVQMTVRAEAHHFNCDTDLTHEITLDHSAEHLDTAEETHESVSSIQHFDAVEHVSETAHAASHDSVMENAPEAAHLDQHFDATEHWGEMAHQNHHMDEAELHPQEA
jgi:hypothetical protein